MNNNPNVPIIGQPVTVVGFVIPVNAVIKCNCPDAGAGVLQVEASRPVQCPGCKTIWTCFVEPSTGQLQVAGQKPQPEALTPPEVSPQVDSSPMAGILGNAL